ncbi:MAG: porin family protein, partial [Duncaniella sp.]|nr:porin family protein [Duncaniella sp.]
MSRSIRLIALIILALAPTVCSSQTLAKEKSLGVTAGYASQNRSGMAGLAFEYAFSRHVVIAPSVDIIFAHYGRSAGLFNLDLKVPLAFSSPKNLEFYPLAGVNMNSWQYKNDGNKETSNRLGFNLGAGLQWRISGSLKIYLQARHTFVRSTANTTLEAG